MAMYNRSRISDAKIVKLSLRSMLMGGVEIYPRCAKYVVLEGVRHRVKDLVALLKPGFGIWVLVGIWVSPS